MSRKWITIGIAGAIVILAVAVPLVWYKHGAAPAGKQGSSNTDKSDSDQASAQSGFDKTRYSTTDPASRWVVVNKQHPLNPVSYAPSDLTSVGNNQRMRAEAASALQHMFADAKTAGYTLTADSGYRSHDYQVNLYNGYVKQYGQANTDTFSARPGYSEHQTGWAVDIGTSGCHIDNCLADTPAGQWLTINAYKYGFLLRYPDDLTAITGYSHESWHFRYIGTQLAGELHTKNVRTLEQFFDITGGTEYK